VTARTDHPATAAAAAGIPVRVDANGTMLRLRALHVMGHGSRRIARATGQREHAIRTIVRGDAQTVSCAVRYAVAALYDQWWDKRAPQRTPAEKTAARTALHRAAAAGWCAAAALDDDDLDTPGYRPGAGFRAAGGTGTAPDITVWPDGGDGRLAVPALAKAKDTAPGSTARRGPAEEAQIA
jgi:hypothetical protein